MRLRLGAAALNLVAPGLGWVLLGERVGWLLVGLHIALLTVGAATGYPVLLVHGAVAIWAAVAVMVLW